MRCLLCLHTYEKKSVISWSWFVTSVHILKLAWHSHENHVLSILLMNFSICWQPKNKTKFRLWCRFICMCVVCICFAVTENKIFLKKSYSINLCNSKTRQILYSWCYCCCCWFLHLFVKFSSQKSKFVKPQMISCKYPSSTTYSHV